MVNQDNKVSEGRRVGIRAATPIIRDATLQDMPFLRRMLYAAVCWDPDRSYPPRIDLMSRREIYKLLDGWGRAGDTALIAEDEGAEPIGAAWYRFWDAADHSYGFVDAATPELGVAVVASRRNRGIGRQLIRKLLERARASGIERVSLSVDPSNKATRLYEKIGFRRVGTSGTSWTMLVVVDDALLRSG